MLREHVTYSNGTSKDFCNRAAHWLQFKKVNSYIKNFSNLLKKYGAWGLLKCSLKSFSLFRKNIK